MPAQIIILPLFIFLFFSVKHLSAQQPKLVLPIGHTMRLNTAHFSPDNKKIVTACNDKTAKLWDVQSGALIADLAKHQSYVNSASYSADGKKIVTASEDSTAIIWDAATGDSLTTLRGHTDKLFYAEFNADGKKIVTASDDGTAIIWDAATGAVLKTLRRHIAKYGINHARFSHDGKKILTVSDDQSAIIWDTETGNSLHVLPGHRSFIVYGCFSYDDKKVMTTSHDNLAKIWDAETGKFITELQGHKAQVNYAQFSPVTADDPAGGKYIVTASADGTALIWDAATAKQLGRPMNIRSTVYKVTFSPDGKKIATASKDTLVKIWDINGNLLQEMKGHKNGILSAEFSTDGSKLVTASADKSAIIFNTESGIIFQELKGHSSLAISIQYSPDGKTMLTTYFDNSTKIWDAATGKLLFALQENASRIYYAGFSNNSKKIITAAGDSTAKIYDAYSGRFIMALKGHSDILNHAVFSSDGKKIVTASRDRTAKTWDAETGALLFTLQKHAADIFFVQFSPDGKKIVTASDDSTAIIWNAETGGLLKILKGHTKKLFTARFSPDGKKIVTCSWDATAIVWDAENGNLLKTLRGHVYAVRSARFSPDGKKIVTASLDKVAKLWDVETGKSIDLNRHTETVKTAQFSPNGKKIVTASMDGTAIIWNASSGEFINQLIGHNTALAIASFSPATQTDTAGGKFIISLSNDNTARVWDTENGNFLYGFFSVDTTDYLVVDKDNRYDGTEAARKLLYFTCGIEPITLTQLKDQLWVPGLAGRILSGETMKSKTLHELNICGLTPVVEHAIANQDEYRFNIITRRGGLGETTIFVNGNPTKILAPAELKQHGDSFELVIPKDSLKNYMVAGENNLITVKSKTADNDFSSRGVEVTAINKDTGAVAEPRLYAVMIGVSDYNGEGLDLKYAAKDAADISAAISQAAKKLLNTKDSNRVFMYNLITGNNSNLQPLKINVIKVLEEIGKKSTASDILLFFFAGHGVASGDTEKKQFYFLTAEASLKNPDASLEAVSISTAELSEWIRPQIIKAQKRILIFDACNSGQAINDFVNQGRDGQLLLKDANNENAKQVKAIDKLNEKSGLFILAASAGNQSAYEMSRYAQGLLTYSLLKTIIEQPSVLDDGKYLNLSRWFNEAGKTVTETVRETGNRQDPQIVSNTNFNIGVVDDEVIAGIKLPVAKKLFAGCNFQNADENIAADNLGLNKLTNQQLNEISSRGDKAAISYVAGSNAPDAFTLSGRYILAGNNISIKVFIRQKNEVKEKIDLTGSTDKLNELATLVAAKAAEWVEKNK